jgi:hypothetical protein
LKINPFFGKFGVLVFPNGEMSANRVELISIHLAFTKGGKKAGGTGLPDFSWYMIPKPEK